MRKKWFSILAFGIAACLFAGCGAQKSGEDVGSSYFEPAESISSLDSSAVFQSQPEQADVIKCRTSEPEKIPLEGPGVQIEQGYDLEAFADGNIYARGKNGDGTPMLYENGEAVGEYPLDLGYASDLVIGDLYFSLVGIAQEDETMNMCLTVYNLRDKTRKIVYSAPLTNYRSYLYPLGDSAVMFSYNGIEDGEKYEFTGVYDFKEDTCKIVSKHPEGVWDDAKTTGQEITAVCAAGERIYFAKEQRINGEVAVFLTCLDRDGQILYEDEVELLSQRWRAETNIQWIDVAGDYIFVSYYTAGSALPTNELKPVVLKRTAEGYAELPLDSGVRFSRRIGDGLVGGRYLLFAAALDDNGAYPADFIAFDVIEEDYRLIRFDLEEEATFRTFADKQGNLLTFYVSDQRKRYFFCVDAGDWL